LPRREAFFFGGTLLARPENTGHFRPDSQALLTIRNERLYRADYSTFEEYCVKLWGMKRHYANRLIGAVGVIDNLGPIGPIPVTESQARSITRLEPKEQ
jgi:hypothetical protein